MSHTHTLKKQNRIKHRMSVKSSHLVAYLPKAHMWTSRFNIGINISWSRWTPWG